MMAFLDPGLPLVAFSPYPGWKTLLLECGSIIRPLDEMPTLITASLTLLNWMIVGCASLFEAWVVTTCLS